MKNKNKQNLLQEKRILFANPEKREAPIGGIELKPTTKEVGKIQDDTRESIERSIIQPFAEEALNRILSLKKEDITQEKINDIVSNLIKNGNLERNTLADLSVNIKEHVINYHKQEQLRGSSGDDLSYAKWNPKEIKSIALMIINAINIRNAQNATTTFEEQLMLLNNPNQDIEMDSEAKTKLAVKDIMLLFSSLYPNTDNNNFLNQKIREHGIDLASQYSQLKEFIKQSLISEEGKTSDTEIKTQKALNLINKILKDEIKYQKEFEDGIVEQIAKLNKVEAENAKTEKLLQERRKITQVIDKLNINEIFLQSLINQNHYTKEVNDQISKRTKKDLELLENIKILNLHDELLRSYAKDYIKSEISKNIKKIRYNDYSKALSELCQDILSDNFLNALIKLPTKETK